MSSNQSEPTQPPKRRPADFDHWGMPPKLYNQPSRESHPAPIPIEKPKQAQQNQQSQQSQQPKQFLRPKKNQQSQQPKQRRPADFDSWDYHLDSTIINKQLIIVY